MVNRRDEPLAAVWSHQGQVRYSVRAKAFPFVALGKGDPIPRLSAANRAIANGQTGFTEFAEANAHPWTGRSDLEHYEQMRVARNGNAVMLLWAELPEDEEDDGDLRELGAPGFR